MQETENKTDQGKNSLISSGKLREKYGGDMYTLQELQKLIRQDIIRMTSAAKSGHPGGSLSAVEILTLLYFEIMHIDPLCPKMEDRDKFVLSKGHAAPALYATLARRGF